MNTKSQPRWIYMSLSILFFINTNVKAEINGKPVLLMVIDEFQDSLSSESIAAIGGHNENLYTSSTLEIIYTGENIVRLENKITEIKEQLEEDGIPARWLKVKKLENNIFLSKYKIKPKCIYLYFFEKEIKQFTNGMNPMMECQSDTMIETDQGYGLLYNKCDFNSKEHLPTVRVWGKNAFNGTYVETPSEPVDFYVNHVISVFTVLRSDSSEILEGIVLPIEKGIPESKIKLERYMPRAYKWVSTQDNKVGKISKGGRYYLFAEIEESGHYRFVNEPLPNASVVCVEAPRNTCFQKITLQQGPCTFWNGTMTDGRTKAVFVTPTDPSAFSCIITLLDEAGNTIEIKEASLIKVSTKSPISEKSKANYKFNIPGYKTVTAATIFKLSQNKKNNNRTLYSKL